MLRFICFLSSNEKNSNISESAIIVSLVKYPTIVKRRPTVIDKKRGKKMKKCLRRCVKLRRHFKNNVEKGRKNVSAVASLRGCDWLVLKKVIK